MDDSSPESAFQATPATSSVAYTPGPSADSVRSDFKALCALEGLVTARLTRDEILQIIGFMEHGGHVSVESIFRPIFAVSSERRVALLNDLITPEGSVAKAPTKTKTNRKRPGPPASNLGRQLDSKRAKQEDKFCPFCPFTFKQAYVNHYTPHFHNIFGIEVEEDDLIACSCCRYGPPDDPKAAYIAPETTFVGLKKASKHVENEHASSEIRPAWSLDNAVHNFMFDPRTPFHRIFQRIQLKEVHEMGNANHIPPTLLWETTPETRRLLENLQRLGGEMINKAGTSVNPLLITEDHNTRATKLVHHAYELAKKHWEAPRGQGQSIPKVPLPPAPLEMFGVTGGESTAGTPYIPSTPMTTGHTPAAEQPSPFPTPSQPQDGHILHHHPAIPSTPQAEANTHEGTGHRNVQMATFAPLVASENQEMDPIIVQDEANHFKSHQFGASLPESRKGKVHHRSNIGQVQNKTQVHVTKEGTSRKVNNMLAPRKGQHANQRQPPRTQPTEAPDRLKPVFQAGGNKTMPVNHQKANSIQMYRQGSQMDHIPMQTNYQRGHNAFAHPPLPQRMFPANPTHGQPKEDPARARSFESPSYGQPRPTSDQQEHPIGRYPIPARPHPDTTQTGQMSYIPSQMGVSPTSPQQTIPPQAQSGAFNAWSSPMTPQEQVQVLGHMPQFGGQYGQGVAPMEYGLADDPFGQNPAAYLDPQDFFPVPQGSYSNTHENEDTEESQLEAPSSNGSVNDIHSQSESSMFLPTLARSLSSESFRDFRYGNGK
ncbi:hypothetical protein P154DRAFT_222825 [Amniculicola lignicola CBS 123094]|uniref:Uncharacterized protein n=1 Tax=Amniculicola lignicola CBS 123094 TaxID=1392246 RepID=A0A6A5WY05_9PLEO|nr:hypothetical protein P154DRAFT_222825 [Amniculicola lignicola CBS 123094]